MALDPLPPEDRDVLAAEYVVGLLDDGERAAAMRRLLADRDFAEAVAAWERRLAPLFDQVFAVPPPADLWPRIAASLAARSSSAQVVADLQQRLARWRGGAIAATLAAAAAVSVLWIDTRREPAPAPPPEAAVVATLAGEANGAPSLAVRYFPATGSMRVRATGIAPGDLVPELWVIPEDGTPRSLGLIGRDADSRIAVDARLQPLVAQGATLAVTMEKPATAPHKAPTPPIIASGKIVAI